MRAPITSKKHIVQHTQFTTATATVTTFDDIHAVAVQDVNTSAEVEEGSVIKAVYIELWLLATANTVESFVMMVEKSQSANIEPSFTNMTTLDAYENKKNIFYTTQGLIAENGTGNPTPVIRQWIKIPKGKQRFGLQDKLRINIAAISAGGVEGCGLTIYKQYN